MSQIFGQPNDLFLGEDFHCGQGVTIDFAESHGLYVGHNVAVAQGTYLRSGNHKFGRMDIPISKQGHECQTLDYQGRKYSVIIDDDVWIGANAIILSGAKIGKGSVLAAGTVIATECPPYSIVAGNPARVIGSRLKSNIKESIKHAETN